jgi:transcriptional regulator GlxA family with amidase domain
MSRSNLYRVFEDGVGVAGYIQRERLLEARAACPTVSARLIAAIAKDSCFADASSFSRGFKQSVTPPARGGRLCSPESSSA